MDNVNVAALQSPSKTQARISVTAFFFMAGLVFASWASRIPIVKDGLGLSDAQLGTVLFALPVGLMVSLPISGWLVTRLGSRIAVIAGIIFYTATLVCIGLTSSTWSLVPVLFIFGLGGNLINISVNTQAVAVEAMYGKSIIASFHGAWSLAAFTGSAIAFGLMTAEFSILAHFATIALLNAALIVIFYRNLLPVKPAPSSTPIFVKPDLMLLQLGLIGFFGMASEGAMFDWSGVYFHQIVHPPEELTTLGFVSFMSTMAGGRFIGDYLTNKFGRKRMLQLSGLLIASGLTLSVVAPFMASVIAGFMLVGVGVSSVVPLVYSVAGKSPTMAPGVALAAVSSISFFGFLIGPPLIGWISETTSLQHSFALIAVLGLCITLMTFFTKLLDVK